MIEIIISVNCFGYIYISTLFVHFVLLTGQASSSVLKVCFILSKQLKNSDSVWFLPLFTVRNYWYSLWSSECLERRRVPSNFHEITLNAKAKRFPYVCQYIVILLSIHLIIYIRNCVYVCLADNKCWFCACGFGNVFKYITFVLDK